MAQDDIFSLFETTWTKLVSFAKQNSKFIEDAEKRAIFEKTIDRRPELALVVLKQLLPPLKEQINKKDIKYLYDKAEKAGIFNLNLPDDVVDKIFLFGEVFLNVIEEIDKE